MKDVTISIIIPAYNEERYLGRCLDAIAALRVQPHEVIVVDNGSADGTAAVARHFPFVRVIRERRRGRAFAQAAGFDAATGTVLARIDADALVPTDWTARIAAHFARPDAERTAWTGGALFYNVRLPQLVGAAYGFVAFRLNWLYTGHSSLWGSSMALPRAKWQEVRGVVCMQPDLHEDLDLAIHLHRAGCRIVYDSHTKVRVELRPAYAGPRAVWVYLAMGPRTLRVNGIWTWPLFWPVNLLVFMSMPFFGISERVARLFGRPPLNPTD